MACVRGTLASDDLAGGTFTITDLTTAGAFGVQPLLNRGQSAILAIGRAGLGGEADVLNLTLAFDHRVADGLEAAAFLRDIKDRLEDAPPAEPRAVALTCKICWSTLERLQRENVASYLVPVVAADGMTAYVCPPCLLGWSGQA
jgi:hypothetical protein